MNLQHEYDFSRDGIPLLDESEVPLPSWTLDELDNSADLHSFWSAVAGTEDLHA